MNKVDLVKKKIILILYLGTFQEYYRLILFHGLRIALQLVLIAQSIKEIKLPPEWS